MTTHAHRSYSEGLRTRPHKPLRAKHFARSATLNVACFREAANNRSLQPGRLAVVDTARATEDKTVRGNAVASQPTGVSAGVTAAVSSSRPAWIPRDDRAHMAVLGTSALMVLSGVVILVNHGLSNRNALSETSQALTSAKPVIEQYEARIDSEITVDTSSSVFTASKPVTDPLTARAAVTEIDAANVTRFSAYENQILELRMQNEQLQEQLVVAIQESDELDDETLYLNEELLRLELALAESDKAANAIVKVQTIYNFVNVPIGSSVADDGSYISDESFYTAPYSVDTKSALTDEIQYDTYIDDEARYDELLERDAYDTSGQFGNAGGYDDSTQYFGDTTGNSAGFDSTNPGPESQSDQDFGGYETYDEYRTSRELDDEQTDNGLEQDQAVDLYFAPPPVSYDDLNNN